MSIKEFFKEASEHGLNFPYANDATNKVPSVTLFFAYLTFILGYVGVVCLMIKDIYLGSVMGLVFWATSVIFYLLRKLSHAKIDLDDKSIDLQSSDEQTTNNVSKETNQE